jgi:predicted outer membrane repeat protein
LVISRGLTINGNGANLLTIRPQVSSFRVFNVTGGGGVNLNNMTISGGYAGLGFAGGGINANGGVSLTLAGCDVSGNSAGFGGGIYVADDTTVNVTASTVSNNTATIDTQPSGGGIDSHGI